MTTECFPSRLLSLARNDRQSDACGTREASGGSSDGDRKGPCGCFRTDLESQDTCCRCRISAERSGDTVWHSRRAELHAARESPDTSHRDCVGAAVVLDDRYGPWD